MPVRIQRRRVSGWRAPEGARYVGRGTKWGNPFAVIHNPQTGGWHVLARNGFSVGTFPTKAEGRRCATEAFKAWAGRKVGYAAEARSELGGRDLMCWCPLPAPGEPDHCHAAVLLDLSNAPAAA